MKLKLMTGYNKRARAFKELRQKFTEITINYLQETLKKYPLDWNQIMKQRAIENLYRQLVSEAYKDQINNVDYNLNERTFSTRMLFDLPFTIKLPPVEDESMDCALWTGLKFYKRVSKLKAVKQGQNYADRPDNG